MLSLILCSRNDRYLGNSLWRLTTALNYIGDRVQELARGADVEVLVADWGSERPLQQVVPLTPAAVEIVRFVRIPPGLARELQQDSPFPEVLALNAVARRARGAFIGRIDQDTLVGPRFLREFLARVDRSTSGARMPDDTTLFFANRRSIPYRFAVQSPPGAAVAWLIALFGCVLHVDTSRPPEPFFHSDVGIWLIARHLWQECGGYDERMIYMNDMEIEMSARLMTRYPIVDLGALTAYDFYHLDHYHPGGSRASSTHRRVNLEHPREPRGFNPNGDGWGLAAHELAVAPSSAPGAHPEPHVTAIWRFSAALVTTALWMVRDFLAYRACAVWVHRARVAWSRIRTEPLLHWPGLLIDLWLRRGSAR